MHDPATYAESRDLVEHLSGVENTREVFDALMLHVADVVKKDGRLNVNKFSRLSGITRGRIVQCLTAWKDRFDYGR
jgi:hypothetical protein